ncbi:hypothetical protein [Trinickia sp. EG282A]|uniref:hypothetical protein n=1 Tax=Trinickia sp. EG282A TaxID=3237013 RepID=UPI0034D21AE4
MRKRMFVYSAFGGMIAISSFEGFFRGMFDQSAGFNLWEFLIAGIVGACGWGISHRVARKLNALSCLSTDWHLEIGRWFLPFVLIAFVPPILGVLVGYLLRENPIVFITLIWINVIMTPLMYSILVMRVAKEPLVHVCFSSLLAWLFTLPVFLLGGQPPQFWFASFPFSALLAVFGYLAAQGVKAIRDRSVAL